jgi:hypothetical protein
MRKKIKQNKTKNKTKFKKPRGLFNLSKRKDGMPHKNNIYN